MTTWQDRVVERSLQEVRARAIDKSNDYLQVGMALFKEHGAHFAVEDIARRSGTSLRSFYKYFASKDELLLALFEEVMRHAAVMLREAVDAAPDDPLTRIQTFVDQLCLTISGAQTQRALVVHHFHLAETAPEEFARVLNPMLEVLTELVEDGVKQGVLRDDLAPSTLASIVLQTVVAFVHIGVLGASLSPPATSDDLWMFCVGGITRRA
jgi:AcrR family transcriptional regulator